MQSAEETIGWVGIGGWEWMEDPWLADKSEQLGLKLCLCPHGHTQIQKAQNIWKGNHPG